MVTSFDEGSYPEDVASSRMSLAEIEAALRRVGLMRDWDHLRDDHS